ncbi:hypothetical protein [Thermosipho globiformans]|uniref:hypothetical protein n=1 Tax=Thermosipho globiformans TaxID=380685 RepID=UPI000F8D8C32|nr:hypothetical protein [Thermosipho globiformans]
MKRRKKRKNLFRYIYILFVLLLVFFLVVILASSIIRYKVNLNELNQVKKQYEELKGKYEKNLIIYEKLKMLREGRK